MGIILLSWFCLMYSGQNINRIREKDFAGTNTAFNDVPPIVAFTTVALGGFRGIAADILWIKSISLQDEGKYFEMVQLASWILKLQPKSTGAVSFLAWNMAYNISIIFAEPEKKWQWVENGINLLRNAIQYNPGNASLCKELAWIYINKIGDRFDSANLYYKTHLALDMEKIIGSDATENQSFWDLMAQTPLDYNEFIKKEPSGKAISAILKNSDYKNIEDLYAFFRKEGRLPKQVESKLSNWKLEQSLTLYLKRRMLREEFGLEPEKIIEINKKFGGLDWRLYSSLAIYWSYSGISISKNNRECRKALAMALSGAALNGKLLLVDRAEDNNFTTCPNFSAFPTINNYFIDKLSGENKDDYVNFYFSFSNKAIPILYLYGKCEQANSMFDYLKNSYPNDMRGGETFRRFLDSYWDDYIAKNNKEQILSDISKYTRITYLLSQKGMPDLAESLKKNRQYFENKYSKRYLDK